MALDLKYATIGQNLKTLKGGRHNRDDRLITLMRSIEEGRRVEE